MFISYLREIIYHALGWRMPVVKKIGTGFFVNPAQLYLEVNQ